MSPLKESTMQIGSVSTSHIPSPVTPQSTTAAQATAHGRDRDGDSDGSTSAAPDSTASSSSGKQINVLA